MSAVTGARQWLARSPDTTMRANRAAHATQPPSPARGDVLRARDQREPARLARTVARGAQLALHRSTRVCGATARSTPVRPASHPEPANAPGTCTCVRSKGWERRAGPAERVVAIFGPRQLGWRVVG